MNKTNEQADPRNATRDELRRMNGAQREAHLYRLAEEANQHPDVDLGYAAAWRLAIRSFYA